MNTNIKMCVQSKAT